MRHTFNMLAIAMLISAAVTLGEYHIVTGTNLCPTPLGGMVKIYTEGRPHNNAKLFNSAAQGIVYLQPESAGALCASNGGGCVGVKFNLQNPPQGCSEVDCFSTVEFQAPDGISGFPIDFSFTGITCHITASCNVGDCPLGADSHIFICEGDNTSLDVTFCPKGHL